jgi:hypothetical protein
MLGNGHPLCAVKRAWLAKLLAKEGKPIVQ